MNATNESGAEVRIAVAGRIGPRLLSALTGFEADVHPRHHVLLLPADDVQDLICVLRMLDESGLEVDSVAAFEGPLGQVEGAADLRPR